MSMAVVLLGQPEYHGGPEQKRETHAFPGRGAARSSCGVLHRRAGIVPNSEPGTIPGLQRTTKRCCAAPGKSGGADRPSLHLQTDVGDHLAVFVVVAADAGGKFGLRG